MGEPFPYAKVTWIESSGRCIQLTGVIGGPCGILFRPDGSQVHGKWAAWTGLTDKDGLISTLYQAPTRVPDGSDERPYALSVIASQSGSWLGTPPEIDSVPIFVSPGPPSQAMNITGNGQSGSAGHQLALPLGLVVTDQYGNVLRNRTVTWAVTGGGVLGSTATTTDQVGATSNTWTLGTTGTQSVTATVDGTSIIVSFSAVVS